MKIGSAVPGTRVGRLVIVSTYKPESTPKSLHRRRLRAVCKCDCGKDFDVAVINLGADSNSCGCLKFPSIRSSVDIDDYVPEIIDLTGKSFSYLQVIQSLGPRSNNKGHAWQCECKCGASVVRTTAELNRRKGKHQSCRRCAQRLNRTKDPGEGSWRAYYNSYLGGAKRRGLRFELSVEEFKSICSQNCYYSGHAPKDFNVYAKNSRKAKGVDPETIANGWIKVNGIDRLDSSKGYTRENVVPCCSQCNYTKLDWSESEFLEIIKSIYEHRKLNET